jgi:hypothetical protein
MSRWDRRKLQRRGSMRPTPSTRDPTHTRGALQEQQTHWEDLRRATENLDHLFALITRFQANEPELKELRRVRDSSKVLEAEHTALQQRCKEQETCMAGWEHRADEHEAILAEA